MERTIAMQARPNRTSINQSERDTEETWRVSIEGDRKRERERERDRESFASARTNRNVTQTQAQALCRLSSVPQA